MNKILSTKQVADILGIHINTVYKYIHSGQLKAFKLGGSNSVKHWRVREEDLELFLQGAEPAHGRHTKETTSDCSEQVAGLASDL